MSIFIKTRHRQGSFISTSSLPDIIFILLFFFMVSTRLRDTQILVNVVPPAASESQKLEKKSNVSYIYVGQPLNTTKHGEAYRIQLNDRYAETGEIGSFIGAEKAFRLPEEQKNLVVSLVADKRVKMNTIQEIIYALRQSEAFRVNYATRKE
ncbi:MAG: biopolymer transporter ExbD [Bacteroidetes bacterium]|nr:biopolymer transporter ExbD [Bacteroidota bacterium]